MRTELEPRPKPLGPEESEEQRRAHAERLHEQLRSEMTSLNQGRQDMFRLMATAIGFPNETDRYRLIWQGLADFVNLDLDALPSVLSESLGLRAVIALCVHGNPEYEDMLGEIFGLETFEGIYDLGKQEGLSLDQAFLVLATRFHPRLRLLLHWIADPNRMASADRRTALSFLIEHGQRELEQYDFDPNDEFDQTGNTGYPLFFWKRSASFHTIVQPIAHFIYERLEQYHDRTMELPEAVPLVLCKRDGCGRISVIQRRTKDFCSSSCRTLQRQKDKAEDHAAYMRKYRKEQLTKPFPSRKPRRP